MKCPQYRPLKDGSCDFFSCMRSDECTRGRLPFWTDAERAGLKAIGEVLRIAYSHDQEAVVAVEYSIRNYVKAARAAKEKA